MSLVRDILGRLSKGLDDAAASATSLGRLFGRRRKIWLVETEVDRFRVEPSRDASDPAQLLTFANGRFVADGGTGPTPKWTGAEIELVLATSRFLFRTVELPEKAQGFLDAIVSGQIDRLTPWSASRAAFGRGAPAPMSGGRLGVTIAATSLARIEPYVVALAAFKPEAIVISAAGEGANALPADRIVILDKQTHRDARLRTTRRRLVGSLAVAGCAALASLMLWAIVGASLGADADDIARQIAERRAGLAGRRGAAEVAALALAARKREAPSSIIVIEKLSRALPDDTYLTRLKMEDGKVEIAGVTREAAALVGIIEQTDSFQHATFSAPTTQTPGEAYERFQIEAEIKPTLAVAR